MNFSSSANATIASNLRRISARNMPRIAPLRNTFSRPVSSGWKPVPTSSRLDTRPVRSTYPSVGGVMRDSTFSSVLLPAPFGPTMPITSPTPTRNETSFSAQNFVDRVSWPLIWRKRRHGPATHDVIDSPSVVSPIGIVPIVYCLPSSWMTMASDDIGEPALHLEEVADADHEHQHRGHAG